MKPKRRQARLAERIKDFEKMRATGFHDGGKDGRLRTGGYRCPGSNKKG